MIVHATQTRATSTRRAFVAHFPLLLYLASVAGFLGVFASIIYGLMQPTVIPNAGLAGYKVHVSTNLFLQKPDNTAEEMERAALDVAETENRHQGMEPLTAFGAAEPVASKPEESQASAANVPRVKRAKPKPKRVAKRDTVADPWRSSWNSPWRAWGYERQWNRGPELTGGRRLWASGDRF